MPNLQQIAAAQANPEVPINENFVSVEHQAVYAKDPDTTTALTWGYLGGRWGGTAITAGTVTLTNAATNYVVVDRSTGAVSKSTATTAWNNPSLYARVYKLTTAGSVVTATEDHRAGPYGVHGGLPSVRAINSQSAAYQFVGTDAFATVLHPSADTTARIFTIPSNATLPYRVGTELCGVVQNGAGTITLAITTDTMRLAGTGSTGSRTIAANGEWRARKITSTEWIVSGTGVT